MQSLLRWSALALLTAQLGACRWIFPYVEEAGDGGAHEAGGASEAAPRADVRVPASDLGDGATADVAAGNDTGSTCSDPAGVCQDNAEWIETGGPCGTTACVLYCGVREIECQAPLSGALWCRCFVCSEELTVKYDPSALMADAAVAEALSNGYCKP